MSRTLIVGCGDLGNKIALLLHQKKHCVFGVRRNIKNLSIFIKPIAADITVEKNIPQLPTVDHIIYCPAPSKQHSHKQIYVDGLKNTLKKLTNKPQKIWLVSSTSVYAENNGLIIDELAKTATTERAQNLLCMERLSRKFSDTTVLRLSGLYSFFRWSILEKISENTLNIGSNHWMNRIHLDDAALAVVHLMQQKKTEPLYLVSDGLPVQMQTLYQSICPILRTPQPHHSKENPTSGKRINTQKLKKSGFIPLYPNCIEEYKTLAQYHQQFKKMTAFQQQVIATTFDIPFGKVTSYQGIAQHTQSPKASRAVGQIMANNPLASQLPCHRVVAHNRQLHGYSSSTENHELHAKYRQLLAEGVAFSTHPDELYKYKIDRRHFW